MKITVSWDKYRSEITTQHYNSNLDRMIDPACRDINIYFLLFHVKIGGNDPAINLFHQYYLFLAEIKDFNVLTDNKQLFNKTVKDKQEVFEKHVEMSRNDDYMTGNLLDFIYTIKIIMNLLV